jgi:hypothetical protein
LGESTTHRDKDIIFLSFSFFSGCYQKSQSHQLSLLDDDDDEAFSQNPKNPKTPNPETQNPEPEKP